MFKLLKHSALRHVPNVRRTPELLRQAQYPHPRTLPKSEAETMSLFAAERLGLKNHYLNFPAELNTVATRLSQDYQADPTMNHEQLANEALLGVLAPQIGGGLRNTVLGDTTPRVFVIDWNMYNGHAPVDQQNRADFSKGDALGSLFYLVKLILERGTFAPEFITFLESHGFDVDKSNIKEQSHTLDNEQPTIKPGPPILDVDEPEPEDDNRHRSTPRPSPYGMVR